ncbi:MAG: alanine--tRNA ligase [Gaiellaceae bacterium]
MRTSAELREEFLSFFEARGHKRLPSWPLIPRPEDHSTLLTTAGMQPQMPYFLGREQPPASLTTLAQKCFRTQDIDEVGLDGHHLTFFEMLGNFSFGQYFKEGAIEYATEFVQNHLGFEWDRIWVTVHAGDPELGLGEDETAIELWERVGMPRERIVGLPSSENFWSVGGPGPCGPDSEIYWDYGEEFGCGEPDCVPACSRCDRFLEFWNLVFMSYELHEDGTLTPLPKQNVDTGLGLERTSAVLQGVRSVYETDAYQTIMDWIAGETGTRFGENEQATKAHRILADHGRGMTFLVGDGVVPSNEGRGYVLRRIIRRAVQQARTIGLDDLWRLTDVVVEQMGPAYPELSEHRSRIQDVIRAEEERFSETLARGLKLFEEQAARGHVDPFELAATYGFPYELTKELARERGLELNEEEFSRRMAEHREISRATDVRTAADIGGPPTEFVGYERLDVLTAISAYRDGGDGTFQAKLFESPFYPEGGGQVTDHGYIEHEETGARAVLRQADRVGDDQVLTFEGTGFEGTAFAEGDRVRAVVDWHARFPTMANHTATHLLHWALREVLGDHVVQAGSAVRPDKLRFDFTHTQALAEEERDRVEQLVNERIFENRSVRAFVTPIEEARQLGAMMLFGEKYGDEVRVVEIDGVSRELCGGTHVSRTAEIGPFVIVSEGSVGAGARRIEALTAGEAYSFLREKAREAGELRAELAKARKQPRVAEAAEADFEITRQTQAGDVQVLVVEVRSGNPLDISDRLKQQHAPAAVIVGALEDGTAQLVINVDESLEARGVHAGNVIREAAALVGGRGGGRPTMARAGGKDAERLGDALAEAERLIVAALT